MRKGMPVISDRGAYRGYYLIHNVILSTWYISKDEQHIGSAPTREAAEQIIDELVG